jgi:hypothetical protein
VSGASFLQRLVAVRIGAQQLGVRGQRVQVEVGQVEGAQPHRPAALVQQVADASVGHVDAVGRVAGLGPALAEDGVAGVGGGAAERPADGE